MSLQRHDLVWLSPDQSHPLPINDWVRAGFPCVVARNSPTLVVADNITLAVCLSAQKSPLSRISFSARRSLICRESRALALNQVLNASQQAHSAQILRCLNEYGCELRVYGSYAWQALTGNNYVHADSDLDLVIPVSCRGLLDDLPVILGELERILSCRIDGEVIFAGEFAVAWREWYSRTTQVLTKTITNVSLRSREELLAKVSHV